MTKSIWTDLERGIKDPQLTTIWRVAEALDLPLEDLIIELKTKLGEDFTLIDQGYFRFCLILQRWGCYFIGNFL